MPRRLEAKHGTSHTDVKGLAAAGHGDMDKAVERGTDRIRQAVGLVAKHQRDGRAEIRRRVILTLAGGRPQSAQPPPANMFEHGHGVASGNHGNVKQRPGRGAYAFRVGDVDRTAAADYSARPGRLG